MDVVSLHLLGTVKLLVVIKHKNVTEVRYLLVDVQELRLKSKRAVGPLRKISLSRSKHGSPICVIVFVIQHVWWVGCKV